MMRNMLAWARAAGLVMLAACTVDPGPAPTACDPEGRCRAGFICQTSTNTCVSGMQRVSVALAGAGSGTVRSMPEGIDCGAMCTIEVAYGTSMTLEATPDAMSVFSGWSGDCMGTGSCEVVADHEVSLTATFVRRTFDLTVTKSGNGGGTVSSMPAGIDCGATCTATYEIGTPVMLAVTPDPGSQFIGWAGDCTGTEACTVTMDAARSVEAIFSPGGVLWARSFGGVDFDSATSVAVDPSDDVIVGGYFQADASFGGATFSSRGSEDVVVGKYAGTDGTHLWSRSFGSIEADRLQAVVVDSAGDVLIGGFFQGDIDFGTGTMSTMGGFDAFVAKLSGVDGSIVWARTMGGAGTQGVFGAVVDDAGDVYVTGNMQGTVDFGSGTPITTRGFFDMYVAKYAGADGAHLWSVPVGGAMGTEFAEELAITGSGTILLVGTFGNSIQVGSTLLTSTGNTDMFVAELRRDNGDAVRAFSYGGSGFDYGQSITVDRTDNSFLVTGAFDSTIVFGGMALVSAGFFDVGVAKISSGGAHLWSNRLGGLERDYVNSLVWTERGTVLAGTFRQAIDAGRTLTSAGEDDGLVASVASDGSIVWSRAIGGTFPDAALAVAADSAGAVFVAGEFEGEMTLDGQTLTTVGTGDHFVVKLGN